MVGDETFCSVSEDEMVLQHLLPEPRVERSLENDSRSLKTDGRMDCLEFADFPEDYGTLDFDGAKFEFFDSILDGADLEITLPLSADLTRRGLGFLDVGFLDKGHLNFGMSTDDYFSQNSDSKCEPQSLYVEGATATVSDLSDAENPKVESSLERRTSHLDSMTIAELHDVFRSTFGRDTFINDKEWLKRRILFSSEHHGKFDNVSPIETGHVPKAETFYVSSDHTSPGRVCSLLADDCINSMQNLSEDSGKRKQVDELVTDTICVLPAIEPSYIGSNVLELTTKKRLRRPTRRYIEESSYAKLKKDNMKMFIPKGACFVSTSHDTLSVPTQFHIEGSVVTSQIGKEHYVGDHENQSHPIRRRGRPRKKHKIQDGNLNENKSIVLHSIYPDGTESLGKSECRSFRNMIDNSASKLKKDALRRKHHRLWTQPEVMKLIEGVSRYGVGRWTEIKRLLFSSHAYRTSVDLKDKWRNLLRATGAYINRRKEVVDSKQSCLPRSIAQRVRELAILYPYPRKKRSKSPSLKVSLDNSETESMAIGSRHGRAVQKKSFS